MYHSFFLELEGERQSQDDQKSMSPVKCVNAFTVVLIDSLTDSN